jgi:hypothetical protein
MSLRGEQLSCDNILLCFWEGNQGFVFSNYCLIVSEGRKTIVRGKIPTTGAACTCNNHSIIDSATYLLIIYDFFTSKKAEWLVLFWIISLIIRFELMIARFFLVLNLYFLSACRCFTTYDTSFSCIVTRVWFSRSRPFSLSSRLSWRYANHIECPDDVISSWTWLKREF